MTDWKFESNIPAVEKAIDAGALAGLRALAERELEVSNSRVPVGETGDLKASGEVVQDGEGFAVVYTAPYAAIVHERTDVHHDDGQAKFLETAMVEMQQHGEIVAEQIRRRL